MDLEKLGMVACLYNYEVACCDEDVVVLLYEGLMVWLENNNKDYFDVDFLLVHPLEYILEETLGP